jgi:NADPH:quinone reductase-like Zn-dependent oxidoreductase
VLVIGGSGGVGSITIQLLQALTDLTVIATASREKTKDWVRQLGAHHVIDHSEPLPQQIEALGLGAPGWVFSINHTGTYVEQIAELIAPQGQFGLIDDPEALDMSPLKTKAVSIRWELMFTRPLFQTPDMARQGEILSEVAGLLDAGKIRSTATDPGKDQRREPEACACGAREWEGPRQARTGGVLSRQRGACVDSRHSGRHLWWPDRRGLGGASPPLGSEPNQDIDI